VTRETEWSEEWEVLRAERADARLRWRGAADGLAAQARDPLGLGSLVRDHPVAAAGFGAAAGSLLVKLLLGRAKATRDRPARGDETARPAPAWSTVLLDAALKVAVPWLVRTLQDKFGWDLGAGAAREPDRPHTADAETVAPAPRS
jgi:hypothetical protein